MPKPIKHKKRPADINQLAHRLVEQSTTELEIAPDVIPPAPANLSTYMAAIGRKGGKIGGKRRMDTLTDKERKKIATTAAIARWAKSKR